MSDMGIIIRIIWPATGNHQQYVCHNKEQMNRLMKDLMEKLVGDCNITIRHTAVILDEAE